MPSAPSSKSLGIRCWIAPRDILPGSEYGGAIIEAIHHSRVLVLVFSSHANSSPQIRREVERAVNRGVPIVPLRIENITPTQSLEYFIGTVHWLDALTPPMEQHLQRLGQAVQALLRIDAPPADGPPPPASAVAAPASIAPSRSTDKTLWLRRNRMTLGAAGLCALLAVIGGIWHLKSVRAANAAECDRLWIDRNSFYKSHGYCFQTQRAKDHFGNTGCTYNDQDYVYQQVFSNDERAHIQDIRNEEKARGCT